MMLSIPISGLFPLSKDPGLLGLWLLFFLNALARNKTTLCSIKQHYTQQTQHFVSPVLS